MSNKESLAAYLYGRDLLNILQDCGDCDFISLENLADELPQHAPRAYSISSNSQNKSKNTPSKVSLCVRDIAYEFEQRAHFGAASHPLCHGKIGDEIRVFARSNPTFHLNDNFNKPIIMIGAGTGIAPYIGFLQQIEAQKRQLETLLIFGERYQKKDFLYQQELENWLKTGVLDHLVTAFSRDQSQKSYVQHAIAEHGEKVWSLLNKGANIYVCGSKENLANSVTKALVHVVLTHSNQSMTKAEKYIANLRAVGRYRQDLY